jgi:hypothetical protein
MGYDYKNLSPADFEDLARDLIGRDKGLRFEAFAPGPDQGMDGRHATGKSKTILQAKHFAGSSFNGSKYGVRVESRNYHISHHFSAPRGRPAFVACT